MTSVKGRRAGGAHGDEIAHARRDGELVAREAHRLGRAEAERTRVADVERDDVVPHALHFLGVVLRTLDRRQVAALAGVQHPYVEGFSRGHGTSRFARYSRGRRHGNVATTRLGLRVR